MPVKNFGKLVVALSDKNTMRAYYKYYFEGKYKDIDKLYKKPGK